MLDVEIFSVGKWNGISFSLDDLHAIAENFTSLAANHKVPLKLGHNDAQPFTDGQPALGWVEKVWVDHKSKKLMATFTDIPEVLRSAIEKRMYRHVSVELDCDVTHMGSKYKYVLSAVAILGADAPAVNTLADLATYLNAGSRLEASRRVTFTAIEGDNKNNNEDEEMTKEELEQAISAALGPVKSDLAKFTAENSALKSENAALLEKQTAQLKMQAAEKAKSHAEMLTGKLEAAVKAGQILPAQRDGAIRFMRLDDLDQAVTVTAEQLDDYIKINSQRQVFSKESGRWSSESTPGDTDPGAQIVAKARELQLTDAKMSFATARNRVMAGHPDLARAWLGAE